MATIFSETEPLYTEMTNSFGGAYHVSWPKRRGAVATNGKRCERLPSCRGRLAAAA